MVGMSSPSHSSLVKTARQSACDHGRMLGSAQVAGPESLAQTANMDRPNQWSATAVAIQQQNDRPVEGGWHARRAETTETESLLQLLRDRLGHRFQRSTCRQRYRRHTILTADVSAGHCWLDIPAAHLRRWSQSPSRKPRHRGEEGKPGPADAAEVCRPPCPEQSSKASWKPGFLHHVGWQAAS